MNISVNIPSYKRPYVKTLEYLPDAKVWVCETEVEDYRKQNMFANIMPVEKGIQGNVSRIRNHILKTEFENGADVVVLMDDDMDGLFYWEHGRDVKLQREDFENFIERYTTICDGFGFKMWGVNLNKEKMIYNEFNPFSTVSVVLGVFSCFLSGSDCWYDEKLPLKEDYDMSIQQLNKYRGILRVNKYHYVCKQSNNPGGCAAIRNLDREKQQFDALVKKWGSSIVREDKGNRSNKQNQKEKKKADYNPVVRVPIRGV